MKGKILIVDDSSTDRLIIKNMLSEYNILTAGDGVEAMDQIDAHKDIDLVILDLNMPKMDGFQVLSILKSNDLYNNLRIIILTSNDEIDNEIKGLKMGAVDFIRKPIHLDSLKTRIDLHIEMIRIQNSYKEKLYYQGLTFDTLFQQAPMGITISHNKEQRNELNEDDRYMVNPAFEKFTGWTKKELIELGWENVSHPDDLVEDLKYFQKLQTGEINSYSMDKRYIKKDGSYAWANIVVSRIELPNDYKFNHICFINDISKRKEIESSLEESERSKSVLLSHLPGMAYRCKYDNEWTMLFVSAGCYKLTGYTPESLINNKELSFNDIITPEYRNVLWNEWKNILAKKMPFNYEYEITTFDGEQKWVLEMGQGIYNDQGEVEALEGIILDISDRKEFENSLKFNSEHDILTGLYNRRYLENILKQDINRFVQKKSAIVSINLSSMHSLSLTYGFQYSQELTKKIVEALKLHCTTERELYSIHEYRFVFYVNDYEEKSDLTEFCEGVSSTLESILSVERIGGGMGVVEIDEDNRHDVELLIKNSLIASEKALSVYERDFGFCFFNKEMESNIIREEEIKLELAEIAEEENNNSLFLQYQPIINLRTNEITGFEALARINSLKLGLIGPNEFIPIAEKTKLIIPLGIKIMHKALKFLNTLKELGYEQIGISINISVVQLLRKNFAKSFLSMINDMNVNPSNITIEITESMFSSDYQEINGILGELKELAIKIAIDDFGTGYSSLARERELNVNILKIDKYFIDKLLALNDDNDITEDIISMAHKLGHSVIAEGVEYEKQMQYLKNNCCDEIQGYFISKPLDEEAALEFLKKH